MDVKVTLSSREAAAVYAAIVSRHAVAVEMVDKCKEYEFRRMYSLEAARLVRARRKFEALL